MRAKNKYGLLAIGYWLLAYRQKLQATSQLPQANWSYLAQLLLGFFFLAAAYHKLFYGFFGPAPVSLSFIFNHWISNRLPLEVYRDFMLTIMPYADRFGIIVIVLQTAIGILLIVNRQMEIAGLLILIVQGNIYLATYHHAELRVLGSQALWFGIFFLAQKHMHGRLWKGMTITLCFIGLMHLYARYQFGDPWPSAYDWQRQHYIENVMGSSVVIKQMFIRMTQGIAGRILWSAGWWVKLVLALGLLTRYRLFFGSVWLAYFTWMSMVWLNAWNCEGVFWVLILYTWCCWEYSEQHPAVTKQATVRNDDRTKRKQVSAA